MFINLRYVYIYESITNSKSSQNQTMKQQDLQNPGDWLNLMKQRMMISQWEAKSQKKMQRIQKQKLMKKKSLQMKMTKQRRIIK